MDGDSVGLENNTNIDGGVQENTVSDQNPVDTDVAGDLKNIQFPELVFGIVAPIGVDTGFTVQALNESLLTVGYESTHIKLTKLMKSIATGVELAEDPIEKRYDTHIRYANALRELFDTSADEAKGNDALALLAVAGIREGRREKTGDYNKPAPKHAYILDQFKRPEEIKLIRKIYGRLFILISVHSTRQHRKDILKRKIRESHIDRTEVDSSVEAERLISRDHNEEKEPYGQRVRDSFHLADAVIDENTKESATNGIRRLVKLFFGYNFITPTHDEYGMFLAKAAALRSADLSRQVGAAIFSREGEVITLGSNEVPKPGGGTYFEGDKPDHRDYAEGLDYNEREKRNITVELLQRLDRKDCLTVPSKHAGNTFDAKVEFVLDHPDGPKLAKSRAMDLLEFGRQIHAEMSALIDAARLGKSVKGATLYCTTFPCHMCTKLILGAGIARVVYIEPYPKSYATEMYSHAIALETPGMPQEPHVLFEPFTGIAPFRYRDLFEKGRRKEKDGLAKEWKETPARPNVNYLYETYLHFENYLVAKLPGRISFAEKKRQQRLKRP